MATALREIRKPQFVRNLLGEACLGLLLILPYMLL